MNRSLGDGHFSVDARLASLAQYLTPSMFNLMRYKLVLAVM
jgi:hypothetical protein